MKNNTFGSMKPKAHRMWQDNDRSDRFCRHLHDTKGAAEDGGTDPHPEFFTEATPVVVIPHTDEALTIMLRNAANSLKRRRHDRPTEAAIAVMQALGLLKYKGRKIAR